MPINFVGDYALQEVLNLLFVVVVVVVVVVVAVVVVAFC